LAMAMLRRKYLVMSVTPSSLQIPTWQGSWRHTVSEQVTADQRRFLSSTRHQLARSAGPGQPGDVDLLPAGVLLSGQAATGKRGPLAPQHHPCSFTAQSIWFPRGSRDRWF